MISLNHNLEALRINFEVRHLRSCLKVSTHKSIPYNSKLQLYSSAWTFGEGLRLMVSVLFEDFPIDSPSHCQISLVPDFLQILFNPKNVAINQGIHLRVVPYRLISSWKLPTVDLLATRPT